ncbi:MAG: outer membrane beta-barrel protein [Acidobacteriota bacterium]
MRKAIFLLSLLLLPALPEMAQAQTRRFELTPTVGYRFKGELTANSDLFDRDLDVRVDDSATFGLIFDIPLTENWQLELLANRQNSSFIVDEGLFTPETNLGDVTVDYLNAGFLYQWGPGQVIGFVSGGVGLARIAPDFPEVESENRFSGNLGGGVKLLFSPNIGLRLEGRGYWVDLDTGFEGRGDRFESDEGLYQGEASAGLIIAF